MTSIFINYCQAIYHLFVADLSSTNGNRCPFVMWKNVIQPWFSRPWAWTRAYASTRSPKTGTHPIYGHVWQSRRSVFHGFPCFFHGFPCFFHGFPWVSIVFFRLTHVDDASKTLMSGVPGRIEQDPPSNGVFFKKHPHLLQEKPSRAETKRGEPWINLGYPLIGGELRQESLELVKWRVGGIPTPLKNDGVRQWEEWMENIKKDVGNHQPGDLLSKCGGSPNQHGVSIRHDIYWILGGLTRMSWVLFEAPFRSAYNLTTGTGYPTIQLAFDNHKRIQKVQRHAKPHGFLMVTPC